MRVAHYMRANRGCESPQEAVFCDTETRQINVGPKEVNHVLTFGWAEYIRRKPNHDWTAPEAFRFTTPNDFVAWLVAHTRARCRTYVFAHNWAFDAAVLDLFALLPASGWTLTRAVVQCPPVWCEFRRDSRTLVLLDTLNWWRVPLKTLGNSLGLPKLDMPARRSSAAKWDIYCRRDVEVIRRALVEWWAFLRRNDLGGFAPTLAGQALRTYRHRFMDHPILIDDSETALNLARAAYHGGRTECFRLGRVRGPVTVFDVNSQYPYVMSAADYPAALVGTCKSATLADVRRWLRQFAVVAHVDIDTNIPHLAHVYQERLAFPRGHLQTTLTSPDLFAALARGELRRVHQVALYSKARLFQRFVAELYGHRVAAIEKGDQVASALYKILLNSLYGKFGQRGGHWTECGTCDPSDVRVWVELDADTGHMIRYRSFGGIVQQREGDDEARESHPAIAAHVTAQARRLLWQYICIAGRANVIYCDTDSIWVVGEGAARLTPYVHPTRLGALKIEACHAWVHLHGPKDYVTPTVSKTKGVRTSARWLDEATVEQEQWSSLAGLMRTGGIHHPTTKVIRKHLARCYTKGRVEKSGAVSPWTLSEW